MVAGLFRLVGDPVCRLSAAHMRERGEDPHGARINYDDYESRSAISALCSAFNFSVSNFHSLALIMIL